MLMIDGCAGKKGASQAMRDRGWTVVTVDNNPVFEPDILVDIRQWTYKGPRPDLMWFSPPCTEFSRTFLPWIKSTVKPDMSIMLACKRIIDEVQPRYWVIENVKGAVRWFEPILGRPSYICNPYYLWGSFPSIDHIRVFSHKEKITRNRPAERAVIPYRLSRGLAAAIEQTISLPFYPFYPLHPCLNS
jgi:hypothetical protein